MRSFSLLLIGVGMLGSLIASSIGRSYMYMPRANEGQGGSGEAAAQTLERAPMFALAYGIGVLAIGTARSPLQRRWPLVIAWAFVLSMIARFTGIYGQWQEYSVWIQPQVWSRAASWPYEVLESLLGATAALMLRRVAATGAPRLRLFINLLVVTGLASAVLGLASRLHSAHLQSLNMIGGSPFNNSSTPIPFVDSYAMSGLLQFFWGCAWWITWPAVGLLAFHLRMLGKTARNIGA
jgi:hypothetical protein